MAPKILEFPAALEAAGVNVRYLPGWDEPYQRGGYWKPNPDSGIRHPDADPHGHMWHHTASSAYTPNLDKANGWAGMGADDSLRLYQTANQDSYPVYVIGQIYPAKYTSGSGCKYVLEDYVMKDEHFVTRQSKTDDYPKWYGNSYYWNTEVVLDGIGSEMDDRLWEMLAIVGQVQNEVMGWTTARHIGHAMHSRRKIDLRDGRYNNMAETILSLRRSIADVDPSNPPIIPPPQEGYIMQTLEKGDGFNSNHPELNPHVQGLQGRLKGYGFEDENTEDDKCGLDGKYGSGTTAALLGFLKSRNLPGDGTVCDDTVWMALDA